jgi:hypothetical protein
MQPVVKSIKELTCVKKHRSPSISLTPTSKRTDDTTLVQPAIQFNDDFDRLVTTNVLKLTNASYMNKNQSGRDSSKAATKQNMQFRTNYTSA